MFNDKHQQPKPSPEQREWQDLEMGMFIHWSPTTYMQRFDVYDDFSVPLQSINPVHLNAEQWVDVAESMGARYIVIVAKHVGGFCIWQTDTTEYGIKNTPWRDGKGDILADLSTSCRKRGMKLGVYLSPRDDFLGAKTGGICANASEQERYNRIYRQQLTEVLRHYGEMCEVWFDGSNEIDVGDILQEYAPRAMVFQSKYATIRWVGNEDGIATDPAWNAVSAEDATTGRATRRHGTPDGDVWLPLECDARMRAHWFWRADNAPTLKSKEQLMEMYYKSVGHGAVLLLNHTPDTTGKIPDGDAARAAEFGEEIRRRFRNPVGVTHGKGDCIELDFPEQAMIDHIIIKEDIREGECIRAYVVEALTHGAWKKIGGGTAVGRKKIDRFQRVAAKGVRLRVLQYSSTPQIKSFAAYHTGVPYEMDVLDDHPEKVKVGEWGPEIFYGGSAKPIKVDLTFVCDDAGEFLIEFIPTGGAHPLHVESLVPEFGGHQHPEWISTLTDSRSYLLSLPGIGESIAINVVFKSGGGRDTFGRILVGKDKPEAVRSLYNYRNDADAVRELAEAFFTLIDWSKPGLEPLKSLYQEGHHRETLRVYRSRFLQQLDEKDWLWDLLGGLQPGTRKADTTADELMEGLLRSTEGRTVHIGDPGRVDWSRDLDYYERPNRTATDHMLHLDPFYPLLEAYLESGNELYIRRWSEYADDLLLHRSGLEERSPIDIGYNAHHNAVRAIAFYCRFLSRLRLSDSGREEAIPETTFARILMHFIRDYVPVSILYSRANPQNWQLGIAQSLVAAGALLDDFQAGSLCLREGLKALETYDTHVNYPDGSELQRDIWYNFMWIEHGPGIVRKILQKHNPILLMSEWGSWLRDSMLRRANFLLRVMTPTGQYPILLRNDLRLRSLQTTGTITKYVPEAAEHPDIQTLFDLYNSIADQAAAPSAPLHTSDSFPYGGYFLIRSGWEKGSAYGVLFAAGKQATDGFRVRANNKFALAAFGEDMLVSGEQGAYAQLSSPVLVDGYGQNCTAEVLQFGHKRLYPRVHDRPNPFRHHHSEKYDYVEGLYDGPFGVYERGIPEVSAAAVMSSIHGVSHFRSVHFLREHGLWIMTDRLMSDDFHAYEQLWEFPITPAVEGYAAFAPENLFIEPTEHRFGSRSSARSNISLRQFSPSALTYDTSTVTGEKICSYQTIKTRFSGAGRHVIVTLIYPHRQSTEDLNGVETLRNEEDSVTGFKVRLSSGSTVQYLASMKDQDHMRLDNVALRAESLLVVRGTDGTVSGLALGSTENDEPDFEFIVNQAIIRPIEPIYAPIMPVMIDPPLDVFMGSLQIQMRLGGDESAVIHYTLDGTDPAVSSPVYDNPITITDSVIVKARAFRKGVAVLPGCSSGTHVSPVTRAFFRREASIEPAVGSGKGVALPTGISPKQNEGGTALLPESGLTYRYYEGRWQDLVVSPQLLRPMKTGIVHCLFDISARESEGPFAFHYAGWLHIPADGVYTFYAPEEFLGLHVDAGYDLRLTVAGRPWQPQGRRHAYGTWSIALAAGKHRFTAGYVDYRGEAPRIKLMQQTYTLHFDRTGTVVGSERKNFPGIHDANLVWDGIVPVLEVSGPGVQRQPIPATWFTPVKDDE